MTPAETVEHRSPRGAMTVSGVPEPVTSTDPSPSAPERREGLGRLGADSCLDV